MYDRFRGSTFCLLLLLLIGSGCQQARYDTELDRLREELKESQERFEQSSAAAGSYFSRQLVHLVWFKMKAELSESDAAAFMSELNKLAGIDQVNGLEIGQFQDLGDDRAMAELDLVMRMSFDSEDDYRSYQDHPVHQQLKQDIGPYLAGPPVTYDYWTVKQE